MIKWTRTEYVCRLERFEAGLGIIRIRVEDAGPDDEGAWWNWWIVPAVSPSVAFREDLSVAEGGARSERAAKRDAIAAANKICERLAAALGWERMRKIKRGRRGVV